MDWFKRYAIPGAYSVGLTLAWLIILYPCRIKLSGEGTLTIVGGIFAGGFLPFGYLMCMVGEAWYNLRGWVSIIPYGNNARARFIADATYTQNPVDINDWVTLVTQRILQYPHGSARWLLLLLGQEAPEIVLEPCSMLAAVSRGSSFGLNQEKFVQEWIRKRMDIVVMNQAITTGTLVCTAGVFCLAWLPGWSMQPHEPEYRIWFLVAEGFLCIVMWFMRFTTSIKIDIVVAGVFNLRRRSWSAANTVTVPMPTWTVISYQ